MVNVLGWLAVALAVAGFISVVIASFRRRRDG